MFFLKKPIWGNVILSITFASMKQLPLAFYLILLVSCLSHRSPRLAIATAANVQFAMQEITEAFTQKTGIECDIIIGSSGKLTAQINEGAPYDVFVSADMKYPRELFRSGKTTAPPEVYVFGKLVLWTMRGNVQPDLPMLVDEKARHIAIANPKTAPYGRAAVEVLNHFKLYDAVQHKLVFGESIAQTNQFVVSQTADFGLTAKSVVLSKKMKGRGQWMEMPEGSYSPIGQGAVVIKNGDTGKAGQFYEFLFSEEAKGILQQYGYGVN